LDEGLVEEATQLINAALPQRKLEIIRVVDGNRVYFRVNVVVSFSLSGDYLAKRDLNVLRIVEFVPKEFAANARELYSPYGFNVVEDDPIIEFRLDREQFASGEISYGLDRDLTEEDANALMKSNVVNKYLVPPVLLGAALQLSASLVEAQGTSLGLVLGVAIVVVVAVALLLGVVLYRKRKRGKEGFDLSVFQ
jgi:hypothetical protein